MKFDNELRPNSQSHFRARSPHCAIHAQAWERKKFPHVLWHFTWHPTSIDLEWNALWGQRVASRFTSCIITSQQNNNDLLNSSNKPRPDPQIKVHLQRRREIGDCDSRRNNTSLLSLILMHKTDRQTDRKGEWLVGREDCVNTYQVVNTLSVWATMKDIKAATSGMFVNPAYCAVLAAAATADSSTPPAVNNLMAVACFLRPYSPWILFPLRNSWISCPCPAPSLLYPNPCLSSRLDSAKFWQAPIRVSQSNMSDGNNRFTRNYSSSLFYFDRADSHGSSRLHLHCSTCFALLCLLTLRWFKDELNLQSKILQKFQITVQICEGMEKGLWIEMGPCERWSSRGRVLASLPRRSINFSIPRSIAFRRWCPYAHTRHKTSYARPRWTRAWLFDDTRRIFHNRAGWQLLIHFLDLVYNQCYGWHQTKESGFVGLMWSRFLIGHLRYVSISTMKHMQTTHQNSDLSLFSYDYRKGTFVDYFKLDT